MTSLWLLLPGLALAGFALGCALRLLARRRERMNACAQVLRMAREVRKIARHADDDLGSLADNIRAVAYRERQRRLRRRADTAIAHADRLHSLSLLRLRRALSRFQRDARELQLLRLELHSEMARSGAARG